MFEVTDVASDVTADSAAHARDQAVTQAQRAAFLQLLERLGADPAVAAKLSDDDIATLVQSFEVQNERSSSVRYLGTFTVQFKPNAVRSYLTSRNASFSEVRSTPVVILPIVVTAGHAVLWEETTRWRLAWENQPRNAGAVPIILPAGGLDDIAVLSTEEAAAGNTDALRAFTEKYAAGGATVAVLNGDLANPSAGFTLDVQRYDTNGMSLSTDHLTLPSVDKTGVDAALNLAAKQVRRLMEKNWRHEAKQSLETNGQVDGGPISSDDTPVSVSSMLDQPTTRLPATVPAQSLAEWAQIRGRLAGSAGVTRVDVITLARGTTSIEIEFHGTVDDLRAAVKQQRLQLSQDTLSGAWTLRSQ